MIPVFDKRAGVTDDETGEIQNQKRHRSNESLHRESEEIECEHIEEQVPDIRMDEPAHYHRVEFLVPQEEVWPEQELVDNSRDSEQPEQADCYSKPHNGRGTDVSRFKQADSSNLHGLGVTMTDRREFLQYSAVAAVLTAAPAGVVLGAGQALPTRMIPGTDEALPIIGMGNASVFRQSDADASWKVISLFQEHGSSYIDLGGVSRFVVADLVRKHGLADTVFLGNYFSGENDVRSADEATRLLEVTGKTSLDLMQSYAEDAVPYWDTFRRWKDEGLTRYIGVARHRSEYYEMMTRLLETETVDFLQVNYSLLETGAEDRVLPMAMDKGAAVTINRPFINGQFFDVIRGKPLPAWAADFDCESWAQFSLKFILSHPAVNCVLTETSNPRHALDNLGAGYGRMPDASERKKMLAYIRTIA